MMTIAELVVDESYTEYAVLLADVGIVECDALDEAEDIVAATGGEVVARRVYITEWQPLA